MDGNDSSFSHGQGYNVPCEVVLGKERDRVLGYLDNPRLPKRVSNRRKRIAHSILDALPVEQYN